MNLINRKTQVSLRIICFSVLSVVVLVSLQGCTRSVLQAILPEEEALMMDGHMEQGIMIKEQKLQSEERQYGPNHFKVGFRLDSLGQNYQHIGEAAKAEKAYKRAITIYENLKDHDPFVWENYRHRVFYLYQKLGELYLELEQHQQAVDALSEALSGYEQLNDHQRTTADTSTQGAEILLAKLYLARAYRLINKERQADALFREVLEMINFEYSKQQPRYGYQLLSKLQPYYTEAKLYSQAISDYQQLLQYFVDIPDSSERLVLKVAIFSNLAEIYLAVNNLEKAQSLLQAAEDDLAKVNYLLILQKVTTPAF